MPSDLLIAMIILWALSFLAALFLPTATPSRVGIALGCACGVASILMLLPGTVPSVSLGFRVSDTPVQFQLDNGARWLLLFGLLPAFFAAGLGTTASSRSCSRCWLAGLSMTLLGAFGVFGLQDSMSFLIAWEVMSLGGAVMILGERVAENRGGPTLFMLALLEVGAVGVLFALLLLGNRTGSWTFVGLAPTQQDSTVGTLIVGLLLLFGFGAKLGMLPFYEWFPAAYGSGSGATGVIFSGIVLNAAFFALSRGVLQWLPHHGEWAMSVAIIMIAVGVISAILTIFMAFQEEDWRRLLSLSSAENAGVAVGVLGASLLFAVIGSPGPAALAWIVCLIHLAGHSLAKGTLFLTADGVFTVNRSYFIRQTGLLRNTSAFFGIGALFAAMSLAALPPQSGFVSEWYVFQSLFHGMQSDTIAARLTLALAAAGLALVVAVALATFAKLFGVGLLGDGHSVPTHLSGLRCGAVFILGLCVLGLAVGMPWWVQSLGPASQSLFGVNAPSAMKDDWLLVPLSGHFAFISPTKLVIAGPLLALIPIGFYLISRRRFHLRRVPVWSGGRREDARRIATTPLAFSNALRTFYGFIYGPTHNLEREYDHGPYFVKRLIFNQEVAPIFGPYLFAPLVRLVRKMADKVSILQSGYLNFYNALIGMLLVLILGVALFYR
ncbi:proton-conducting transporter membrane subunit [Acidicapsa dinghuensis]|uniref:Proton-conducting transporter membrane subunit n=1 Tax=Acidicapsa dinghuensis TaxID=2218256 RepID=A0ABW1EDT7_9BACT|nr:proton-conducting transporter membrane subunit [Acidicapsa dinghuensis]